MKFQAVDCEGANMTTAEDVKEATTFPKQAGQFKTPSKRKRGPGASAGPFGNDWVVVGHDRVLPEDPLRKLPSNSDTFDAVTVVPGFYEGALQTIMGVKTSLRSRPIFA